MSCQFLINLQQFINNNIFRVLVTIVNFDQNIIQLRKILIFTETSKQSSGNAVKAILDSKNVAGVQC